MSKLKIERKPKRGDVWRVSWDDAQGVYRWRCFTGRGAETKARALYAQQQQGRVKRLRLELNGGRVEGADDRYAVPCDGKPARERARQGTLTLGGGGGAGRLRGGGVSRFWVSWALKDGRRIGRTFAAREDAEAFYAEQETKVRRLRLEQGSRILKGDRGVRLVQRDGKPQRETVTQGRLWEGEG